MPSTPTRPTPPQTRRLLRATTGPAEPDTTDYELSASAVQPPPAVRFVDAAGPPTATPLDPLDADARRLFQQRLRLCCVVAAVPFTLFFLSTLTGFVELFSRQVVGLPGLILSGGVLAGLIGTFLALSRHRPPPGNTLRAVEVGLFGGMAAFFAYWQFMLLTSQTLRADVSVPEAGKGIAKSADETRADAVRTARQEQYAVGFATVVVHINWAALILFHGMLVPNTLARGAGTAAGMVSAAVLIDVIAVIVHDPTRSHAGVVFSMAMILLAAAGLSVFGTAKTVSLQQEVASAKQVIRELGQYRLRRKLGQGGMGEVYLAEHRFLKRPCAVKKIHAKYLNNAEQIRRFEREVQTTAKLRHPNTVEVYDYGRADDGTFYYVMEYLQGLSLEELVNRYGPQPADRVIHILRQVCGALKEAHAAGLVHRDIKPSNILVLTDGTTHDQAKVLDFGLVQSLAADADPHAKITRDGLIVGTPEYMSPEQAQGMPLDERSDLFSLGTVAYFLLTGKEAFHRDNPVKTLLAVVSDEPQPPGEVNPFVPDDLALVVSRCQCKTLEGRFSKASELEAALSGCVAADGWSAARAADWWEAHPKPTPGTDTDLKSLPLKTGEPGA